MKRTSKGFSLTELLIGVIVAAILFAGIYKMMGALTKETTAAMTEGKIDEDLARFVGVMTADLQKAGSDPTLHGALLAYIMQEICGGKIHFKYGVNPDPTDSTCSGFSGEVGILSYLPYDANGDGSVDPEEGLNMEENPTILRTPIAGKDYPTDYVVYALIDTDSDGTGDSVVRRVMDNNNSPVPSMDKILLRNVVEFQVKFYGLNDSAVYGEITESSFFNDIKEVEVKTVVHGTVADPSYNNPQLDSSSPWYHYRTKQNTFRVSLIIRKA